MIDELKSALGEQDDEKVINLIRQRPELLDATDASGISGFILLAYYQKPHLVEVAKQIKTRYSFHEAVVAGNVELINAQLASDNGLLNQYGAGGFTPIALAAFFGQEAVADLLLEHGADPNIKANNAVEVNALHAAVARGNLALCQRLVEQGADVNIRQQQGITPLHSAAHQGNLELVTFLVKKGADLSAVSSDGKNAIGYAEELDHQSTIDYLKKVNTTG